MASTNKLNNGDNLPTRRGSHRERRAATRAKVLRAGIDCLSELGYHATTTTLVAERAGVSRGALLQQFPTRLDLIAAIAEHVIDAQRALNEEVLEGLQPGLEQYKGLTDALWRGAQRPGKIALIEIHLATRSDRALAERLRGRVTTLVREQLESAWTLAEAAGIEDRAAADALAALTIASIWGLSIMRLELWQDDEIERAYALLEDNRDRLLNELVKPH